MGVRVGMNLAQHISPRALAKYNAEIAADFRDLAERHAVVCAERDALAEENAGLVDRLEGAAGAAAAPSLGGRPPHEISAAFRALSEGELNQLLADNALRARIIATLKFRGNI
jgi:hypothetical protein